MQLIILSYPFGVLRDSELNTYSLPVCNYGDSVAVYNIIVNPITVGKVGSHVPRTTHALIGNIDLSHRGFNIIIHRLPHALRCLGVHLSTPSVEPWS